MATFPIGPFQTLQTKYEVIKAAILKRQAIKAYYDGQERLVCPHVLGTNKQGAFQALFYQFGGASNSRPIQPDGSPDNWRCLLVERLDSVEPFLSTGWHTAPNHSRPQTCVKEIHFEVIY